MSKNYVALAGAVVEAIGGGGNVAAVTHCMTRLRFVLNDDSAVDAARLKAIPGVLGVVRNENQCQVIIGNTVSQAYAEVLKLLPEGARVERALPRNDKITLRRIGAGILDAHWHHVAADPGDYRRFDGQTAGDGAGDVGRL